MAQKAETKFKVKIRPKLDALPNCWLVKTQQLAQHGIPDFLLCIRGKFIALELKKDAKEEPKPLQIHNIEEIMRAKGLALVVYPENWDEVYSSLVKISEGKYDRT